SVPSRYHFTACILSFEENLAIKNAPPIVNYVSNNWGALQEIGRLFNAEKRHSKVPSSDLNHFNFNNMYWTPIRILF
ncbi:hypothetical protein, partial [Bacillus cereus]|uniref:hypothetical protein n=1 Tax=Bacillus cereus TaxID=1396 RepID=UPI001C54E638